jgi:hypothetical protein
LPDRLPDHTGKNGAIFSAIYRTDFNQCRDAIMGDNSSILRQDELFSHELPPITETDSGYIVDDDPVESHEPINDTSTAGIKDKENPPNIPETDPLKRILEQAEKERGKLSFKGDVFDPVLHQYPPSETKTGKWRTKSKAQKEQWGLLGPKPENEAEIIDSNQAIMREAENMAMVYAGLHVTVFGPDGMAKSRDQIVPLVESWNRYMVNNGVIELPDWMDLILSHGNYSRTIIQQSKTNQEIARELFGRFWRKTTLGINKGFKAVVGLVKKG